MATTSKNKTSAKAAQSKGKKATKQEPEKAERKELSPSARTVRGLIWGILGIFLGAFCTVGYFHVDAVLVAPVCGFLKGVVGYGYYLLPPALIAAGVILLLSRGRPVTGRVVCLLCSPSVLGALFHTILGGELTGNFAEMVKALYGAGADMQSGGVLGGLIGWGLRELLSLYLALPLLFFGLAALLMVAFRITPQMIVNGAKERRERARETAAYYAEADAEAEAAKAEVRAKAEMTPAPVRKGRARHAIDISTEDDDLKNQEDYEERKVGFFNTNPRVKTPAEHLEAAARKQTPVPEETPEAEPVAESVPEPEPEPEPEPVREEQDKTSKPAGVTPQAPTDPVHVEEFSTEVVRAMRSNAKKGIDAEELVSATEAVARAVEEKDAGLAGEPAYRFPPVELLRTSAASAADGSEEAAINRERLQTTLDSFGVDARITDITRGPTVTRYDLELEAGVKLSKLTNLAGDLALALGVTGVRIAPIPDKISTVGVEVPNKIVSTIYLRDIIDTDAFRSASSRLSFAIGKDIGGNPIVGNIAKLPHLLIAGTTGSGKSVCMNSLILSLLYKATPEEVRLIMIDPKMVELGVYNGIPHLYIPVVTDPKKAAGSLQWSVVEMLKRYRLFSEAGVRDLAGYNGVMRKNGEQPLPQVVIVIDELADLMMVASKEVEESICRVAQMGRAAGMHLVIATQRPSADVITGLMKANIPSRIAFAVSSAMESRIILDQTGAEKLVGSGDMLYAPIGIGKPSRIQGAFVTDEEREQVVGFVKENGEAEYSEEILSSIEQAAAEKEKGGSGKAESVDDAPEQSAYDELLPQAVDVIFETKQASVSMLQRRLKLGYSRAARIVDQMEEIGVVGPFEGSKPRQIMITREQWLEMQTVQGTAPLEKLEDQTSFAGYEDAPVEEWEDA